MIRGLILPILFCLMALACVSGVGSRGTNENGPIASSYFSVGKLRVRAHCHRSFSTSGAKISVTVLLEDKGEQKISLAAENFALLDSAGSSHQPFTWAFELTQPVSDVVAGYQQAFNRSPASLDEEIDEASGKLDGVLLEPGQMAFLTMRFRALKTTSAQFQFIDPELKKVGYTVSCLEPGKEFF